MRTLAVGLGVPGSSSPDVNRPTPLAFRGRMVHGAKGLSIALA